MTTHPVQLSISSTEPRARIHVLLRLLILALASAIGCSSVYWLLYLALPVAVALALSSHGPRRYLDEDAPRILRVLSWLASAYAYLWMLTDGGPDEHARAVELRVEVTGQPSPRSALMRLLSSIPALILLVLLSIVAALLWVLGAIGILVAKRMPQAAADFLELTLRYQFRLFAYHLSLVEAYPGVAREAPRTNDSAA